MIDTHCHIFKEYYDDIDLVIKRMDKNIIIVAGTNDTDNKEVIELCNKYDNVYGVIGIHPSEIENIDKSLEFIEQNLNNKKIVGIGEIGLDYFYQEDNKELQRSAFIKQILLAKKYNKTIVVHSRNAIQETYDILNEYSGNLKKIIHCYSSSYEMALNFIKINCMLGIGGVLTFKNSKLSDVVSKIDLKHLVLETDSPYLTPEPFRGKTNEPYNIYYVAEKIAEIKGISLEEVLKQTTANSISQFDLNVNMW